MKKSIIAILFILLLSFVIAVTVFGQRGYTHLQRLQNELKAIEQHNAKLQTDNDELRHEIERLKHDLKYIEELARVELGLLKDGERVYQFEKKQPEKAK
jgi:cell division protein FtsB